MKSAASISCFLIWVRIQRFSTPKVVSLHQLITVQSLCRQKLGTTWYFSLFIPLKSTTPLIGCEATWRRKLRSNISRSPRENEHLRRLYILTMTLLFGMEPVLYRLPKLSPGEPDASYISVQDTTAAEKVLRLADTLNPCLFAYHRESPDERYRHWKCRTRRCFHHGGIRRCTRKLRPFPAI